MTLLDGLIIYLVAAAGSVIGTLVGGTSMITIPTLMLLGLPSHTAIGTDRFGMTGSITAGWYRFHVRGLIDYRLGLLTGIPILAGAVLGSFIVLRIDEALLRKVIAAMTVLLLVFLVARPKAGIEKVEKARKRRDYLLGGFLSFFVGIYGGFYGASAGTFISYILIFLFGQTFLESAATWKLGGLALTAIPALIFAAHGAVHYGMALAQFAGSFTGSLIGVHFSDRIGNVWIRRIFTAVVMVMVIKLFIK